MTAQTQNKKPSDDAWENRRELTRLFQIEYSDKIEVSIRFIGTIIGAWVIWLFTGWISAWYWLVIYFSMEAGYFLFLLAAFEKAKRSDVIVAQILFVLTLASYVWMPVKMIASPNDTVSVSGACILGGVLVFLVRRSESALLLTLAEVAAVAVTMVIGVGFVIAREPSALGKAGLIFAVLMLIFYLVHNAYLIRRQGLQATAVAERTHQAEKMEAIGKLAGGVAHDFNNILTSVIGNLDLIEEVDDPKLRQEFRNNARQSALHGAEVVAQLLVYARRSDLVAQFEAANHLLGIAKNLSRTLIPPRITVDIQLMSQNRGVLVDQALFTAAILNLMKNGADAIENNGTLKLSARSRRLTRPVDCLGGAVLLAGDYIVFEVSDTGSGIPEALLDKVIDPFFTTKPLGKGSGLGLAMVVGFAQRSGGGLIINSSPAGTTIEICLPEAAQPRA